MTIFTSIDIKSSYKISAQKKNKAFQFKMVEKKDICSSPPPTTPKLQLAIEQPSAGGWWNLSKKDTSYPKTKKMSQWDGRIDATMIKSNPVGNPVGAYTCPVGDPQTGE